MDRRAGPRRDPARQREPFDPQLVSAFTGLVAQLSQEHDWSLGEVLMPSEQLATTKATTGIEQV
jgi:hypothetical protein